MKKILFLFISPWFAIVGAKAQLSDLSITVSNIKKSSGVMEISLFTDKANFLKPDKAYKTSRFEVNAPIQTFMLKGIKSGEYAVSLYHDINADGMCNTNFFGIPQEGFGFSNNIKPVLSPPKFDACKFNCSSLKNNALAIKLIEMK